MLAIFQVHTEEIQHQAQGDLLKLICDTYQVYIESISLNGRGFCGMLTLKVLVATIDTQWEGMGDVGSARYEPALLPPCLIIRVLSYSN